MSSAFPLDYLSPTARHVLKLDAATAYGKLVPDVAGSAEAKDVLDTLRPADAIGVPVADEHEAACVVAGLWLWHDYLDLSHAVSQGVETPTGSFWHAVMHRREGDFGNAKYWYRRCPTHPARTMIAARADALIQPLPLDKRLFRLTADGWDAAAFVDLAEQCHADPADPLAGLAVQLQRVEWQTLFDLTVRRAAGK